MRFTVELPDKLSIGVGSDVQHVMKGVIDGWMSLPIDVQKTVGEVNVAYHGSTTLPLPSDVFDIEVKLMLSKDCVPEEHIVSLRINDFRKDLSAKVSYAVSSAVKQEIEAFGQEYEPATRLLL